MPELLDTFTVNDRKELIKQSFLLDGLTQDVIDLKILFNETLRDSAFERRIRTLEDAELRHKIARENYEKAASSRMNAFLIVATLAASVIGIVTELVLSKLTK